MEDYIFSWELEKRKSRTLYTKIWQMVQSSNTKAENLEHDSTEICGKIQRAGLERRSDSVQMLV